MTAIGTTFTDAASATTMMNNIDAQHTLLKGKLSALGSAARKIDGQLSFSSKLSDVVEAGIGNLVDADLATESARENVRYGLERWIEYMSKVAAIPLAPPPGADGSGATFAVVIGDDEAATGEAQLKALREEGVEQRKLKVDDLAEAIIGQLIDSDEEE